MAFTASVSSNSSSWSTSTLVFPVVITNLGNGYNPNDEVFTAPTAGVYVFFVNVQSYNSLSLYVDIVVNGEKSEQWQVIITTPVPTWRCWPFLNKTECGSNVIRVKVIIVMAQWPLFQAFSLDEVLDDYYGVWRNITWTTYEKKYLPWWLLFWN